MKQMRNANHSDSGRHFALAPPRAVMRSDRRAFTAFALVLAVLAALPVAAVVSRGIAFDAGRTWQHLASTVLPGYVGNTLALVVIVGVGVGIGGTAAGWLVARHRFPGSRFFEWALLLPLAMPSYVMAYAYTDFLQYAGPLQSALRGWFGWTRADYWFPDVRTLGGAAVMFVFTLYPYVYLLARTAFLERPPALLEAARTLGLNRRAAFWRVELPLARPAIAAGIALALMETLADYGTVAYFAVDTFTTGVYRAWFSLGDRAAAAQLATVLLAFVVLALTLERASRGAARTYGGARGKAASRQEPERLTGVDRRRRHVGLRGRRAAGLRPPGAAAAAPHHGRARCGVDGALLRLGLEQPAGGHVRRAAGGAAGHADGVCGADRAGTRHAHRQHGAHARLRSAGYGARSGRAAAARRARQRASMPTGARTAAAAAVSC